MCMNMFLNVYMCSMCMSGACRSQEMALDAHMGILQVYSAFSPALEFCFLDTQPPNIHCQDHVLRIWEVRPQGISAIIHTFYPRVFKIP